LADCHLDTIGGVRRLSQTQLTDILGQRGAAVWQILHDPQPEDESIPKRVEPEQTLGHTCDATTPTGFDPTAARAAVLDLVRDVGFQLRQHRLACQRLRLQARWIDGREHEQRLDLPVPSWHDDELLPIAQKLLSRLLDRRVHTMRLRLQACNLIAGYDQAVLFSPARQRQLEHVRDHLRLRFNATILCSGRQLQEQVTTEQATAEQATAEQATAEQATAEQATAERVP
jgi:nucleotidyltransferase/DNA polymerase involved in DNA repair